ncbi:hypothetical protein B0H14DRAFT_3432533 [Mycena olivaceomarginata]|nr:hypothetical protein B0H14DRAFT_3432533 [Mycena olivaceomarginata]
MSRRISIHAIHGRIAWLLDETINVDCLPTDVSLPRRYSFRYFRITFSRLRATAVSAFGPSAPVPALPLVDAQLRAIDAAAMHTLRDCMHAVFEDAACGSAACASRPSPTMPATFAHFALVKRCLYLFAAVPRTNAWLPACVYEFPAQRGASDYIVTTN